MKNVAIIGCGSFGTALAHVIKSKGHNIKMYGYTKEECELINNEHRCKYIDNYHLDESIRCFNNIEDVVIDSDYIILVSPSYSIKDLCKKIRNYYSNQKIILASKGLDNGRFLSEVIKEELNVYPSIISGPSRAEQIVKNSKTYIDYYGDESILELFETEYFKMNKINDKIGIELSGALKNVIVLGCGILEGMNYETNTISYFITEGLKEIKDLGIILGANESTFYGLSGLGDLLVTFIGDASRNKNAGILLGKGLSIKETKEQIGMTIEGLNSLDNAMILINNCNYNSIIIKSIYDFIYNDNKKIL